ncbi:MAG TPA: M1 family peptidase [Rhodospirillales bacterium]|nr:M1 family peptidase [Rhodospirillales bacterium]
MTRIFPAVFAVLFLYAAAAGAESVLHHDMDARLDVNARVLAVTDRIKIHGQGPVTFYLAPRFEITSLSLDGKKTPPAHKGADWVVDLGKPGEHQIVVDYAGTLAPLPKSPRDYAPGTPIASPEGSFLPESAGWRPSFENREFTYRLAVQVADPHKAVAPGRLVEEKSQNGLYRAVFESSAPVRELLLLAGPYVIQEKFAGGVRLRTYFHQRIASLAAGYLDSATGYIDLYNKQIGDYPFPAFHIVSGPLPVGWGYAGLTYMGAGVLRLPFIRHTSLGHEALHNWWGNGVYVDYRSGNWGEGLTTFMADYAFALQKGAEAGAQKRLGWLRDYAALPPDRDQAAAAFVVKSHGASQVIGYNKVAFFFHMLRRELGDKTFNAAIRRFWETMKFKTAAWKDLRRAFEETSKRPLKGFFDQWLRRPGAPKLKLETVAVEKEGARFSISFTLSQESPVYVIKVPLRVSAEGGEKWFDVTLDSRRSSYRIFTESRPAALTVDPNFDIFRRLDAAEAPPILRDVTLKSNAVALILAGNEQAGEAARRLAGRLMDAPPKFGDPGGPGLPGAPLLIIGTTPEIKAFLNAAKLGAAPQKLAGRGTARVWTARREGGWPLLAVAAENAEALAALMRPLPHYGRKSFLVFEGSRAVEHGTWPGAAGPLTRRLALTPP